MTGPATFASDADLASTARERLDAAAEAMAGVEDARRSALAAVVELWPTSAWLAAGATSAKKWLLAYTHCAEPEAHRLERLARLCARHPNLAEAVLGGALPLSRAHTLAHAANPDREPWLADSLDAFLGLHERGCDDGDWAAAVRHWTHLVDQERHPPPSSTSPPPSMPGPTTRIRRTARTSAPWVSAGPTPWMTCAEPASIPTPPPGPQAPTTMTTSARMGSGRASRPRTPSTGSAPPTTSTNTSPPERSTPWS